MRIAGSDAKSDLIGAAMELFKARGFKNVTIKDICEQAGCSAGTFYYHFGSMDGLVAALHNTNELINARILGEALALPNAWEKLWRIHRTYVDMALSFGHELFVEMLLCKGEYASMNSGMDMAEITHIITPIIRQGQLDGEIRSTIPAEELAYTIGLTMVGVDISWFCSDGQSDLAAVMRRELANVYDVRPDLR